jgi:major membrane immunogen (membrane-anchored lipoprotein)
VIGFTKQKAQEEFVMKKTAMILSTLALLMGLLAGCGGGNNATPSPSASAPAQTEAAATQAPEVSQGAEDGYADGVYYAEGEMNEQSGWKEIVSLKVEGGKIVSANWNGLNKDGGLDKKASSEAGKYGMVAGGAKAEWHVQAADMEKYLVEKQSLDELTLSDDGKTDAVSSVSIGVGGFVELVKKALDAGPVEAGPYKDGTYKAEEADFDAQTGFKYNVTITVANGNIIAAQWNATNKDGGDDKLTLSKNGEYGMKEKGGAIDEWHVQAARAEQFLIEKNDPAAIVFDQEKQTTDAISGVTIKVAPFATLAAKALEGAK